MIAVGSDRREVITSPLYRGFEPHLPSLFFKEASTLIYIVAYYLCLTKRKSLLAYSSIKGQGLRIRKDLSSSIHLSIYG